MPTLRSLPCDVVDCLQRYLVDEPMFACVCAENARRAASPEFLVLKWNAAIARGCARWIQRKGPSDAVTRVSLSAKGNVALTRFQRFLGAEEDDMHFLGAEDVEPEHEPPDGTISSAQESRL